MMDAVLLANGILIFFTCLLSIPAVIMPTSRGWLKCMLLLPHFYHYSSNPIEYIVHGWFVVICALMTMVLGINEWLQTLTARANLATIWGKQPYTVQSLLQTKVYIKKKIPLSGYIAHTLFTTFH